MKPYVVGHRVLVKPISLEEHDPAFARAKALGITIADQTERQESSIISNGMVMQVGEQADQAWCKVGDRIDYVRHGGMFVVNPDNKEDKWYVINDEDVLVIWRQE